MTHRKTIRSSVRHGSGSVWADHPLRIRKDVTAFSEGGGIGRDGKGNGFCPAK
ncbi:MAG: hypothetical protein IJV76_12815 [Clostridia bacterium]|nr:hypothetical protein [Clostridia bacterium]